jgi:photosystem II stability/assembly factor-like uncharacterized protein
MGQGRVVVLTVGFVLSLLVCVSPYAEAQQPIWQQTHGPQGLGALMLTVGSPAAHGGDAGDIYAWPEFSNFGFYRSSDLGQTWKYIPFPTDLPNYPQVTHHGNIICGGTISTDEGTTWQKIPITYNVWTALAIELGDTLFAITDSNKISFSTDEGVNWQMRPATMPAQWPAMVWAFTGNSAGYLFALTGSMFFRSSDHGFTWQQMPVAGKNLTTTLLGFSADRIGDLFGASDGSLDSAWLFHADPDGSNAAFVEKTPTFSSPGIDEPVQFALTPEGACYVQGDSTLWKTTDIGKTWSAIQLPEPYESGSWGVVIDSVGDLIVGTGWNNYIMKSSDASWQKFPIPNASVKLLTTWKDGGILAATANGSLNSQISFDDGVTWTSQFTRVVPYSTELADTNFVGGLALDPKRSPLIFSAYQGGTFCILSTSDGCKTWTEGTHTPYAFPTSFTCDRTGTMYYGTTTDRLFLSSDNGTTWDQQTDGITNPAIYSIAVAPTGNVFAGSVNTIFRNEQGSFWDKLKVGLTKSNVTNIAIDSQNVIYAGTDHESVIRSTDNGDSWQPFSTGLPIDSAINALVVTKNGSILAATNIGVFILGPGQSVWKNVSAGLLDLQVLSLAVGDSVCYAGTGHDGVFRSSMGILETAGVAKTEQPSSVSLFPNYPNPLSSTTQLSYTLAHSEFVTLSVSDILGNVRITLHNGHETVGQHSVILDGSTLPSGVYYYTLETASNRITRTMMVVK